MCNGADEAQISDFDIHVFPNSALENLELSGWASAMQIRECRIEVYTSLGESVSRVNFSGYQSSVTIDMTDKSGGIYLVKVNFGGKVMTKKFFYP